MNIIRVITTTLATLTIMSAPLLADGWREGGISQMNKEISETNFIVDNKCSGTLLSAELRLILTNYHCVDNNIKTEIRKVTGPDGEVKNVLFEKRTTTSVSQKVYSEFDIVSLSAYVADVVNYNKDYDLAIIQLKVQDIPHTQYAVIFQGDVERGMEVYTVGNPLGMDATLGRGVISSTTRRIVIGNKPIAYYQMDSIVEGGSSGGAMYTLDGQLIGVPGAKYRGTGINLAIPLPIVLKFIESSGYDVDNGRVVLKKGS